jgi:hypothetical protein
MKPDTTNETPKNRHARRAIEALGRSAVIAPEWVSCQGICQLLSISKSTLRRIRLANPDFPSSRRFSALDMERFSVVQLRAWCEKQPLASEITGARGRRGGARLVGQETQPSVTEWT